ncbi:MAG: 2-oxoacid:acceptor oxidoreductase family protein [Thermoprotei archaeon]
MLVEFRFHGRGGQGAVTAADLLVKAAYLEGKWGQSYPFFGAERRGAPVTAYARISDKPLKVHYQIYEPDVVVVLDPSIPKLVNVTSGLKQSGIIIINTGGREIESLKIERGTVYTVNATAIAIKLNLVVAGWPIVNTGILGAVAKATNIIKIESLVKAIKDTWKGNAGESNAKAALIAYEEVTKL